MIYFFDSSALVKRYNVEVGSQRVIGLLQQRDRFVVARLTEIEVSSALVRSRRATNISANEHSALLATFDREFANSLDVIEFTDAIVQSAAKLTRKHALRATDAIQLATSISSKGHSGLELFCLVRSDVDLNAAATSEGIAVLDPTHD